MFSMMGSHDCGMRVPIYASLFIHLGIPFPHNSLANASAKWLQFLLHVFWCQARLIEVRLAKDTQSKRVPFQNVIVDPAILAMAHRNGQAMNGVGGERSVPEVHGLSQRHQIGDPDLGEHRKHPRLDTLVASETVFPAVHLHARMENAKSERGHDRIVRGLLCVG